MEIKKITFLFLVLCGIMTSLCSCESDDEDMLDEETINSYILHSQFTGYFGDQAGTSLQLAFLNNTVGVIQIGDDEEEEFSWGWMNGESYNPLNTIVMEYADGSRSILVIYGANENTLTGYYFESYTDFIQYYNSGGSYYQAGSYGGVQFMLQYNGTAN